MKKVLVGIVLSLLVFTANFSVLAQRAASEIKKSSRFEKSPVRFSQAEAFSEGGGVLLKWETSLESNNLGFSIVKITGDRRQIVNRGLISGAYLEAAETNSSGRKYSFFDASGDLNSTYLIESLNLNGRKNYSAQIFPKQVKDLSSITGVSAQTLSASAANANPVFLKSEKILPSDLQTEVNLNMSQADAAKQLWVAAQPGAKIAVKSEGIYRVTRAQLEAAGFNVNAAPALWQLYVNGNQQAINIGGGGDYIEFYGRGIDTLEADAQIYYLVVGAANGKRIGTTLRRPLAGRVIAPAYAQSFTKKERFIYSSQILNGDGENFFGSVISATGANISVNLSGVNFSSPNSSLDIGVQGLTLTTHQTRIIINGNEIGMVNGNDRDMANAHFDIPTSFLKEGANNLQLIAPESGDVSLFASVKVNFLRKFQADQNRLSFYTINYRGNYVENFASPNIRVFDITYLDDPTLITNLQIEQSGGAYRVYLPSNRGRLMYAVEDSAILPATSVTANQPSTLATTNHNADLVIVTYKDWTTQANDWAAYRRAQGMSVEVVEIDDIYDEFNFGAVSSLSIRNFLQYATGNWQTAPKYILLLGDATYDPKNYKGGTNKDYIPTKLVDTVYIETGSDDALADFNDDGLTEIAIGRIPAQNGQTVTQLLNKVTAFEQNVAQQGLSRGAIFASDVPNGYDFEGLSARLRQQLPQSVPSIMINRGAADARPQLLSEINNGRFLVNYSGHGDTASWAGGFFGSNDPPQLTNRNLSIFTMLTCLNGYFVQADGDVLAEVALKAPNGAVATWASSALTTPDIQEIMATRFYSQIGAGNFTRLGDLVKDAKTAVDGGRDVRYSWVLFGDPTLKVR